MKPLIWEWLGKWRVTPERERLRGLWKEREALTKIGVDYASKKMDSWGAFAVHDGAKLEFLRIDDCDHLPELQEMMDRNARQIAAAMGVPEEHLMPVYPLNPGSPPVAVRRGVSQYDENGRRVSVPDDEVIDQVGALARQMVAQGFTINASQWRQEQLGQFPEPEEDQYEPKPSPTVLVEMRLIELEEWETVARTTTTRRRRPTGRANVGGPATKNDPIFVWGMQSSKPRNGGHFITYEVRLNTDGTTSCNCPGWIFKKKTDDRGCKHTRHPEVMNNFKDYFQRHQRGEQLPTVDPPAGAQSATTVQPATPTAKDNMKGFGRLVILDD